MNRWIKKMPKFLSKVFIVFLIFVWIFSGWPVVWKNPRIPPEIKEAQAAITYQGAGTIAYSARNGTSISPPYPASIAAGDLLVLIIGMKPSTANSGSVTTPTGWTLITSITGAGGYGTTLGADVGNTNLFAYYKVAAGTESGSLTVSLSTNNVSWAQMFLFRNGTKAWNVAGTTGQDTTGDTTVSITFSNDPGVTAGDYILGAMCIPTDVGAGNQFSNEALSQSGVTFGTVTEISEPYSSTGNDIGGVTYYAPVNSGTSSGVPTFTATAGGTVDNVRGPGVFIRIRELQPTFNQSAYRFFNNLNSTDVGTPLANQDIPANLVSGQAFRLRLLIHVGTANLAQSGESFKLQFGTSTGASCTSSPPSSWEDVTNSTVIAFYDNPTPTDGSALTANSNDPTHGTDTIRNQTYEEANPFTNSVSAINAGEDGKWDFSLKDNGAPANTTYCFRVVKADGTLLDNYSVIPQITTGAAAIISVSVSDGSIDYGIIPASSTKSTCELSDTQIVTNDGNVTENFNIKGSTTTCWSLGTTPGNEVYVHKFSTSSCPVDWTGAPALSFDYQPLATRIAPNGTTTLNLQIITPTETKCYDPQSVNVIIQAVQP